MVIDQRFSVWAQESSSASQAENASSILVARSKAFHSTSFNCNRFEVTDDYHKWPWLSSATCPIMPKSFLMMPR